MLRGKIRIVCKHDKAGKAKWWPIYRASQTLKANGKGIGCKETTALLLAHLPFCFKNVTFYITLNVFCHRLLVRVYTWTYHIRPIAEGQIRRGRSWSMVLLCCFNSARCKSRLSFHRWTWEGQAKVHSTSRPVTMTTTPIIFAQEFFSQNIFIKWTTNWQNSIYTQILELCQTWQNECISQ